MATNNIETNKSVDKLLKTDSTNNNTHNSKGTNFEILKRKIHGICSSLDRPSDQYEPDKTIDSIKKYADLKKRILYSEISAYIFELPEQQRADFVANVERLLIKSMDNSKLDDDVKNHIMKIYDHIHLALHQLETLASNDDVLSKVVTKNIEPVTSRFEDKLNNTYKELYAQLIAIVGIFTALSFLLFGGISSLDNIFNSVNNIPLIKIVISGSIWGLMIFNTVFVFLYYVSKMTDLPFYIKRHNSNDKTFFQKYPSYIYGNLILICTFMVGLWLHYAIHNKIYTVIDNWTKEHPICFLGISVLVILVLITVSFLGLHFYIKHKNTNNLSQ